MKQNQPITDEEPKPDAGGENPGEVAEAAAGDAQEEESIGNEPEGASAEEAVDPAAELEAAREESRQNQEKFLRLTADFENYRRRMTREKDELRQFALTSVVEEFLPVLDNLALGLQTADKHPEAANVTAGFRMVAEQIRGILFRQGVEEIEPTGEAFDPHRHESVAFQPDEKVPEGDVAHVVRKGYLLNGRLIRPATVVVSSGPGERAVDDSEAEDSKA